MSRTKFIFMALILVLTSSKSRAAEPTLARLSFWLPPERVVEFEGLYTEKVTPLLKQHGLVESAQKSRTTVDSVFCRLFEFEMRSELVQKQKVLSEAPVVQQWHLTTVGHPTGCNNTTRPIRLPNHPEQ